MCVQGAMLAVWRPTDDVSGLIVEGSRLRIYNLQVAEYVADVNTLQICNLSSLVIIVLTIKH